MKRLKPLDFIIFLFVFLFVYAAANKIMTFDEFQAQLGKSPLIMRYATVIAYAVPAVEIIISMLLLVSRTVLWGFYAAFFLMLTFTGYIVFILNFSPYVPCSCGGVLNSLGWTEHLIFNMVFVLLAIVGIVLYNRQQRKESGNVVSRLVA
jgi:uncharacterized membrane protein YphA (DoxX/SURF4 family)